MCYTLLLSGGMGIQVSILLEEQLLQVFDDVGVRLDNVRIVVRIRRRSRPDDLRVGGRKVLDQVVIARPDRPLLGQTGLGGGVPGGRAHLGEDDGRVVGSETSGTTEFVFWQKLGKLLNEGLFCKCRYFKAQKYFSHR